MNVKISKRIKKAKEILGNKLSYSLEEGIKVLKELPTVKFLETIEAHITLNIDPKYSNQQLRTNVELPNGTGKKIKIAVLTETEKFEEIKKYEVDIIGSEDLLEEIRKGNINFDILITSRQFMPKLTPLGKILGPRGLMPSPKFGTVTENFEQTIKDVKKGKIEYRADKTGIVHLGVGKINFSEYQIKENILALYNSIEKNKPQGVKGKYFKSFTICLTMSPAIKIDLQSIKG